MAMLSISAVRRGTFANDPEINACSKAGAASGFNPTLSTAGTTVIYTYTVPGDILICTKK
jgi:hypothetical protein